MSATAVDTWARDLATEAKELAVRVEAKHDAHDARCNERHIDERAWQERTLKKIDALSNQMWGLALSGVVALLGGLGVVTWTLIRTMANLQ